MALLFGVAGGAPFSISQDYRTKGYRPMRAAKLHIPIESSHVRSVPPTPPWVGSTGDPACVIRMDFS
jgi:hypothetical protein